MAYMEDKPENNKIIEKWMGYLPDNTGIRIDKIIGLIYGTALGDCLGVQVEGVSKEDIIRRFPDGITGLPKHNCRGIHTGDWTDDTDQLILLMEIFTHNNMKFSPTMFASKLLNWRNHGFAELGDLAGMGMGQLTGRVLSKEYFLTDPYKAAKDAYRELGSNRAPNGAIMRCGIMAIVRDWSTAAINQAKVTHADCLCHASVWVTVAICRMLIINESVDYKKVLQIASSLITKNKSEWEKYTTIYECELSELLYNLELSDMSKQGYTLKTLGAGIYALRCIQEKKTPDYKKIQLEIIQSGGDADTNAAVAGSILGAYFGYSALPVDWLDQLRHKDWLDLKIINMFKTIGGEK
jgi:ADP-ribosylglycohydrolase